MTKKRKRLLASLAVLALPGTLALPGVLWRLVGWSNGEPFYQGRPASYYSHRLHQYADRFSNGNLVAMPSGGSLACGAVEAWVRTHLGHQVADVFWDQLDWELRDATAVPVLITLLDDPEPVTRYMAADSLGDIGHDARPAIPKLQTIAHDQTRYSVGGHWLLINLAAADALNKICSDAEKR